MTEQKCKNCGRSIVVMIQKNTGFCTPRCEETYCDVFLDSGESE